MRGELLEFVRFHAVWALPLPLLVAALGAGSAVYLVRRWAPEASGSGIPHVKAVLSGLAALAWYRVLPVKFFGGVIGIGAGLALGREGPTIQMGAATGRMVSGWFSCTPRERRTLIAAGAGAGLAAAFNAPLSGLVFVLEEVQRDFSAGVFTVTLVASAVADVVTRLLLGQLPIFHVRTESIPPLNLLPVALLVGAVAGILGVAFNQCLLRTLDAFRRLPRQPVWLGGALAGLVVGGVALLAPDAVGGGHQLLERMLESQLGVWQLGLFFVLRFVLTMISYGCGAPGGIFAPLLVLGADLGLMIGEAARHAFPESSTHAQIFAVVGMAAYFSAITRAPLTGIVLMIEMTGNYSLVLPLLGACLTAYGIADFLRDRPIYEALLERDLLRTEKVSPDLGGTLLVDLKVSPGAPFEGRRIRDLGLPPGAIIILLRRGLTEQVPTADTRLEAGDLVSVVIAPEAASALPLLRKGVGLDAA
ncbi:MAG: voltage gated Cl- channel protein [Candidatus Binatia bacterium]|nr:MAG: voltage gated Cl- channel protein [Candidatus Binatia bacterium]